MHSCCRCQTSAAFRISHYVGVSWSQDYQQWQARFQQPDGTSEVIGTFAAEKEAAHGYDQYALQQRGPAAVRNFMPSLYTGKPPSGNCFWLLGGVTVNLFNTVHQCAQ